MMKRVYWLAGIAVGLLALHEVLFAWIEAAKLQKLGQLYEPPRDDFTLLTTLAVIFGVMAAVDLLWIGLRKCSRQLKSFFRPSGNIGRRRWKVFFWVFGSIAALLIIAAICGFVNNVMDENARDAHLQKLRTQWTEQGSQYGVVWVTSSPAGWSVSVGVNDVGKTPCKIGVKMFQDSHGKSVLADSYYISADPPPSSYSYKQYQTKYLTAGEKMPTQVFFQ